MKRWYTIDPTQGARDAITWNVGKYGMEIDSYGKNQGIDAKMQIKGIAEIKTNILYVFMYPKINLYTKHI